MVDDPLNTVVLFQVNEVRIADDLRFGGTSVHRCIPFNASFVVIEQVCDQMANFVDRQRIQEATGHDRGLHFAPFFNILLVNAESASVGCDILLILAFDSNDESCQYFAVDSD
ncbi:hypothetical protein KOR42_47340 [Thalassoglobus neptunius]|uniref:Uncharacterized protein n=1 Tax=Thalassoglobus neptunius TaxID=1938619 RepID=A0A5C5VY28_9PLAN|nr:hypothetical protein KOR42_47340 [Thalassoglobus neptunius]